MLHFLGERYSCNGCSWRDTNRFVDDDAKDDQSLRAELAKLVVVKPGEHASGYNAALHDVLAILDRHESDRKQRSKQAIARRKAAGKKIGGDLPYGYELAPDGETLRESPAEQRVIAAARKLRNAGHSLREVARRLKTRDLFPREGDEFHAAQISRMIEDK